MSSEQKEERSVGFHEFADFLYDLTFPPEEKSIVINLGHLDSESETDVTQRPFTMDFLYRLFIYGFEKKFKGVSLTELENGHFEHIRAYIRTLGYDVHLIGYERNEDGEITNVNLGFGNLV
jgi:hypothetical protein